MKNAKCRIGTLFVLHSAFCILHLSLAGCFQNAGTGGTGEIVVPTERLHNVEPFDPAKVAATSQPTTQAATRPTTAPVELTIEQCRQLALAGNLGLKVELLNPTIAKET